MNSRVLSKLAGSRLPLEHRWPTGGMIYLRRLELFILCGLLPLLVIGVLPLSGVPTGLILRVGVVAMAAIVALRAVQHRMLADWQRGRLGQVREMRRTLVEQLSRVERLPAGPHANALAREIQNELSQVAALAEEVASGPDSPLATDLQAAQTKLNDLAASLRASIPDPGPASVR